MGHLLGTLTVGKSVHRRIVAAICRRKMERIFFILEFTKHFFSEFSSERKKGDEKWVEAEFRWLNSFVFSRNYPKKWLGKKKGGKKSIKKDLFNRFWNVIIRRESFRIIVRACNANINVNSSFFFFFASL